MPTFSLSPPIAAGSFKASRKNYKGKRRGEFIIYLCFATSEEVPLESGRPLARFLISGNAAHKVVRILGMENILLLAARLDIIN
jgi:hypothetical protein